MPRKTLQNDFRFRLQPLKSAPDAVLLKFIKSQGKIGNDLMLRAIRAFWLPIAYEKYGTKQEQDLKRLAINMIFVLEEQANYLRTAFNLTRPMATQPCHCQQQIDEGRKKEEIAA